MTLQWVDNQKDLNNKKPLLAWLVRVFLSDESMQVLLVQQQDFPSQLAQQADEFR